MVKHKAKARKHAAEIQQDKKDKQEQQDQGPEAQQESSERFTCEFHDDFQGIGMLLDVDECGRLVVQEVSIGYKEQTRRRTYLHVDKVNLQGEAGKYPTLCQQNLHIVAVGIAGEREESAADELLRQLMTLPRPVRVEFATTTAATAASTSSAPTGAVATSTFSGAAHSSPPTSRDLSKSMEPAALPAEEAHEAPAEENAKAEAEDGHEQRPGLPLAGEEQEQAPEGEAYDHSDQSVRTTAEEDEGVGGHSPSRPQRHETLPGRDRGGRVDDKGPGPTAVEGEQTIGGGERTTEEDHYSKEQLLLMSEERRRQAPRRPQRHGTLPEGSDWEENLRSGGSGTAAPPLNAASAVAPQTARYEPGNEEASWSVAEEANSRSNPTYGASSLAKSWYSPKDDSDDSERGAKTASPRHSWYTANRMRGGHASDVNHSTPFTRAAALAKARASEHQASPLPRETEVTAAGEDGDEPAPPCKGPPTDQASKVVVASPADGGGGRDGGRLPNAVSARQHRSPSWYREDKGKEGRSSGDEGITPKQAQVVGVAGGESSGGVDDADALTDAPNKGTVTNDSRFAASATDHKKTGPTTAAAGRGSASGQQPSKAVPRTGAVSARLHHSPSHILRGGATLGKQDITPGTTGSATMATAADGSNARSSLATETNAAATKTANNAIQNRAAPAGTTATESTERASQSAAMQKRAAAKAELMHSFSPSVTDSKPGTHRRGENTPSASMTSQNRRVDEEPAASATTARGVGVTADRHQRRSTKLSTRGAPSVAAASSRRQQRTAAEYSAAASSVDARQQRGGGTGVGSRRTNTQQPPPPQQRTRMNPSIVPADAPPDNDNDGGGDGENDHAAAAPSSRRSFVDDGGNAGGGLNSLQNYKPFSRRQNGRRTHSDGVILGRGRSTSLRPSFFLPLPEEDEPSPPPPPPPPPPPLSLGGRRPSVGPANPRAMYGHVPPPPPPDEQPQGSVTRRPSVVALPPPSPESYRGASMASRVTLAESSEPGGRSRVARFGAAANDRRKKPGETARTESGRSASASSMRKSKSNLGESNQTNKNSRAPNGQKRGTGVASYPNLLAERSQGNIKVEKLQLVLNNTNPREEENGLRYAQSGRSRDPGRQGAGGGVGSAADRPGETSTAWRKMAARDTAAALDFAESSVQELRKLAAATAAARQESSSSSEGGGEGDGGANNGRRRRSSTERDESPTRSMSWEQQLRTTTGVNRDPAASNTTRRRQNSTGKMSRPSSFTGLRVGGEQEGGANTRLEGETPEKKTETDKGLKGGSAQNVVASAPPPPTTPPPIAWNRLQIDVGKTQTWGGAKESGQPPAVDEHQHVSGGGGGSGQAPVAATTSRGGVRGRSSTGRFRASSTGRTRAHSSSRVTSSSAASKSAAVAAAAAAAAAAACSQLRPKGTRTTPTRATEAARAAAATAAAGVGSATMQNGNVEGREASQGPEVARVRVSVRSSVYLIVAEVEKAGSMLLDQVSEAEKLRHGQNAATVTGLTNESTGDTVDLDVPAERSISSGDSLTAIVVGWSPTTSPPGARTKQSRRLGAGGEGESGGATSARGRAPQRQHHRHDGSPRSREGSRPSPLRLEFNDNEGRGGDIDQLRDDVARRLYKERLLAGRGAAAASSPTRPIGSPAITPVTGGGRGASPEHSRPTSPRSASPRGATKGPGRSSPRGSVRDGGGGGSRPGSPTRSVCSAASGYTHCSGFSVRSRGPGRGKGAAGNSEAAFMAQSTLTPEELDGILKEELLKSRKWSARNRNAQDKICRVWEERGADYNRLQREFEEAEAIRQDKARQRRETEAAQAAAKARQRAARAESALQQARSSRGSRDSRAREAEAAHRRRMQQITDRRDREQRMHATKVQAMDRRREDVRDSFLDMVDAENETAIQALETPLEMLNRALEEGDEISEKKARRAMLRQAARERVHVREKAARVLADQRRLEQKNAG
ncbi:hypothetical protein Esi_0402_0018 [Ectocarpus siliculosus]|uniref:Uncharacterized protein n=1 Tax=Ectocarpus siliculosus TaxID=2880 RepID=D7G0H5_ECTSI|nr:hypothetical protein Esi_0402_0018 [Ectocarpus siliculosus]|eukprot:CBJ33004.1 hypothetical protein Esi_0402_0018 [Ectocarpus siliculosus]